MIEDNGSIEFVTYIAYFGPWPSGLLGQRKFALCAPSSLPCPLAFGITFSFLRHLECFYRSNPVTMNYSIFAFGFLVGFGVFGPIAACLL